MEGEKSFVQHAEEELDEEQAQKERAEELWKDDVGQRTLKPTRPWR